mmetsp:Transcript_20988/g.33470  ORF Transcript_20988/g.33470 Transcript_20988/m.33470 type:complete len:218 (-) Transcript_20988:396-1049(-)
MRFQRATPILLYDSSDSQDRHLLVLSKFVLLSLFHQILLPLLQQFLLLFLHLQHLLFLLLLSLGAHLLHLSCLLPFQCFYLHLLLLPLKLRLLCGHLLLRRHLLHSLSLLLCQLLLCILRLLLRSHLRSALWCFSPELQNHCLIHRTIIGHFPTSLRNHRGSFVRMVCPHLIATNLRSKPPTAKSSSVTLIPIVCHDVKAVHLTILLICRLSMVLTC